MGSEPTTRTSGNACPQNLVEGDYGETYPGASEDDVVKKALAAGKEHPELLRDSICVVPDGGGQKYYLDVTQYNERLTVWNDSARHLERLVPDHDPAAAGDAVHDEIAYTNDYLLSSATQDLVGNLDDLKALIGDFGKLASDDPIYQSLQGIAEGLTGVLTGGLGMTFTRDTLFRLVVSLGPLRTACMNLSATARILEKTDLPAGADPEAVECFRSKYSSSLEKGFSRVVGLLTSKAFAVLTGLSALVYFMWSQSGADQAQPAEEPPAAADKDNKAPSPSAADAAPQAPEIPFDVWVSQLAESRVSVKETQEKADKIRSILQQLDGRTNQAIGVDIAGVIELIEQDDIEGARKLYQGEDGKGGLKAEYQRNRAQSADYNDSDVVQRMEEIDALLQQIFDDTELESYLKKHAAEISKYGDWVLKLGLAMAAGDAVMDLSDKGYKLFFQLKNSREFWEKYFDPDVDRIVLEKLEKAKASGVCEEAGATEEEAAPAPVPAPSPVPQPNAASRVATAGLPGGAMIPEITIPELPLPEFGFGYEYAPATGVQRGGVCYANGEVSPMEIRVYNMQRTTMTSAAELYPEGSGVRGGAAAPKAGEPAAGSGVGGAMKGVALYAGGYVVINGVMMYFDTPEEMRTYIDATYGMAGLMAMAKNPAFLAYVPAGLLGADIAHDLTYDAIENTEWSPEVKGLAHLSTEAAGGVGAVGGTMYVASRLGATTPVTLVITTVGLGIYEAYRQHKNLSAAYQEFLTKTAEYPVYRERFAAIQKEMEADLNSGFDDAAQARLQAVLDNPEYQDLLQGMGWWFYESYYQNFEAQVRTFYVRDTITPEIEAYQHLARTKAADILRLGLQLKHPELGPLLKVFRNNLIGTPSEVNISALKRVVHDPVNNDILKKHGALLVETYLDPWLSYIGYNSDVSTLASWTSSSSEEWARRAAIRESYGEDIAALRMAVLNPGADDVAEVQYQEMRAISDPVRVAHTESRVDTKVAAGEITPERGEEIKRDAVMNGSLMTAQVLSPTQPELEYGRLIYSRGVSEYVDWATNSFEEEFWSGNSTSDSGMSGFISIRSRGIKMPPQGDAANGDITPGVMIGMVRAWIDDVQQHLHNRESAGWGQTAIWGGYLDDDEMRLVNQKLDLLRAKITAYEKTWDATILGDVYSNKDDVFGMMRQIDGIMSDNQSW